MTLAIFAAIFLYPNEEGGKLGNHLWIFGGIIVGTIIGWLAAVKVQMTAMPQMVSLFNGMGGACAALIGLVEFPKTLEHMGAGIRSCCTYDHYLMWNSYRKHFIYRQHYSFPKAEWKSKRPRIPYYNVINSLLVFGVIGLTVCLAGGHITGEANYKMWTYVLFLGAS